MWIKRIGLKNLLTFRDTTIEFGPGLNVVISLNEAGKSSLMRGIVTALYRDASSRRRDVVTMQRWGSGTLFTVEIDFVSGEQGFAVFREFEGGHQRLFREGETIPLCEGKDVDRYMREQLVLPEEELFVRICAVHHEELARVTNGKVDLGERIEEILGGGWGEVSPSRIKQMVDARRAELRRGIDHPAKRENWGALKQVTEEVGEIERALSLAEGRERSREELLRELSEKRRELDEVETALQHFRDKQKKAEEYEECRRKKEEVEGRMQEARKKKERVEELILKRNQIVEAGRQFPPALAKGDDSSIDGYHRDLDQEAPLERVIELVGGRGRGPAASWKVITGFMAILGGVLGAILYNALFLLIAVGGAALLVWWIMVRLAPLKGVAEAGDAATLEGLRMKRREWAGERSLDESRKLLIRFSNWKRDLDTINGRLRELIGTEDGGIDIGEVAGELDGEFGRLAASWDAREQELRRLEPFRLDADGLLRLEDELRKKEERFDTLRREVSSLEREVAGLQSVEMAPMSEQLVQARETLDNLERKDRILAVILEYLDEARRQVAGFLAEKLPSIAGRHLFQMTRGRYGTLYIDPLTLRIETVPATGDIDGHDTAPERILPDALSQGAQDQVHLAVRLALVELISAREPQPLFLDDPFVHFDPERRERALKIINKFSKRHQVVLFTCDPFYCDLGGRVIRLDVPSD